ncbi:MAG TPA: lipase maturation factor family protein [Candidatus Sumerlaeota bacterium]|nr:lipase maturation factor family protein [Candidatus Sumerlaeota bacterium]
MPDDPATQPPRRPVMVYDGQCGFCRYSVQLIRHWTRERIVYRPFQEVAERCKSVGADPAEARRRLAEAVHLIEPETGAATADAPAAGTRDNAPLVGRTTRGAEAILRAYAIGGLRWPHAVYRRVPGVRPAGERLYAWIARHRPLVDRLARGLEGRRPVPRSWRLTRWMVLRGVALIFFIAFASLLVQVRGLIGSDGILPVGEYLERASGMLGPGAWRAVPTLSWISPGDAMLVGQCLAGMALAILAGLWIAPGPALLGCWGLYLSLTVAGQRFMGYQWDALLLETGLLAALWAPWRRRPRAEDEPAPSAIGRWLLWWLLFRLMFESGVVKLASGDPLWRELAALDYHYWTQPLPTWIGLLAAHLPAWFQHLSCAVMFGIELGAPWLILFGRKGRLVAFALLVALQVLILLTGNYTFFNGLTIVLCLSLLDDAAWVRFVPRAKRARALLRGCRQWRRPAPRGQRGALAVVAGIAIIVGGGQVVRAFDRGLAPRGLVGWVETRVAPLNSFNPYGLFAVMTPSRPEIVIEGTADGVAWTPYEFKWKPGRLDRRPRFVAPHQPRLDWQMWFAALGSLRGNAWIVTLMERLLEGEPSVLGLLGENPFKAAPPLAVRAVLYEYRPADPAVRRETGQWWTREPMGLYAPPLALRVDRAILADSE